MASGALEVAASAVSGGGFAGTDGKWTSGELKGTAGSVSRRTHVPEEEAPPNSCREDPRFTRQKKALFHLPHHHHQPHRARTRTRTPTRSYPFLLLLLRGSGQSPRSPTATDSRTHEGLTGNRQVSPPPAARFSDLLFGGFPFCVKARKGLKKEGRGAGVVGLLLGIFLVRMGMESSTVQAPPTETMEESTELEEYPPVTSSRIKLRDGRFLAYTERDSAAPRR
ncbi:hypothetical protein NL676_029175 [Syzygium grande]|nr:hypothetical protein NL676_029175 [Syzygium grande]